MSYYSTRELAIARADLASQLGPDTCRVSRQLPSNSATGGPDLATQYLTDRGGSALEIYYRLRSLRQPRTKRQGEQDIVIANYEITLPASYIGQIAHGDVVEAAGSVFYVHAATPTGSDALACRLECLRIEDAQHRGLVRGYQ